MKSKTNGMRGRGKSRKIPHHAPAKTSIEPTPAMKKYVGGPIRGQAARKSVPFAYPLQRTATGYSLRSKGVAS